MTVREIARSLKLSQGAVRARVAALRLKPTETRTTGKRGRPAYVFTPEQVEKIRKAYPARS